MEAGGRVQLECLLRMFRISGAARVRKAAGGRGGGYPSPSKWDEEHEQLTRTALSRARPNAMALRVLTLTTIQMAGHTADEETKEQRGDGTCPRLHR